MPQQPVSINVKTGGTQGKNLEAMLKNIRYDDGVRGYKVGWPVEAKYDDGTEVAKVALWNEFGVPENGLPERPFFRNANSKFLQGAKRIIMSNVEFGKLDKRGNSRIAQAHVSLVRESIRDLSDPENAASTVSKKKSSNPLIDTGRMRRQVTHEPLK